MPRTLTTTLWFNLAIILPVLLGLSRSGSTHAVIFAVIAPGGSGAAGVAGTGTFVGDATFGAAFCVAALAAVAGLIGAWKAAKPKSMATMAVNNIDCFISKFILLGTGALDHNSADVTI